MGIYFKQITGCNIKSFFSINENYKLETGKYLELSDYFTQCRLNAHSRNFGVNYEMFYDNELTNKFELFVSMLFRLYCSL